MLEMFTEFASLALTNGASIFGRITPLIAAQWVGFINIHTSFAVISGIMLFCWTRATTVPEILAYNALYGVSSGEHWPLMPPRSMFRSCTEMLISGAYAAAFNAAAASFSPHPNQVGWVSKIHRIPGFVSLLNEGNLGSISGWPFSLHHSSGWRVHPSRPP